MKEEFEFLVDFDPVLCMQKLYTFHEDLRALNESHCTTPLKSHFSSAQPQEEKVRYSANDFYDEEEEYYDQAFEHELYEQYDQDYDSQEGSNNDY